MPKQRSETLDEQAMDLGKPLVDAKPVDMAAIQDDDTDRPAAEAESAPAPAASSRRGRAPEPLAPEVQEVLDRRAAKKGGRVLAHQVLVRAGFDKGHQGMEVMGLHRVLLMQEKAVRLKISVDLDPEFAPGLDRERPMTANDIGREYERLTRMFYHVPEGKEEGENLCLLKFGPLQSGGLGRAIQALHLKYLEKLERLRESDRDVEDLTAKDFWEIIASVGGRPTDDDTLDQYDAASIGMAEEHSA